MPADGLATAFALRTLDDTSLSRWSSVYRAVAADGSPVVVKRAASPRERAEALAAWTRAAAAEGISVVVPHETGTRNPQPIGEDWWVAYPFVEGRPYAADAEDLRAAGVLLGRLHASDLAEDGLRRYDWDGPDESGVEDDLETLADILPRDAVVAEVGRVWRDEALPALRAAREELPVAMVSSDFKAANLVYTDAGPVLVDPDNGGVEPRIFDLALAVVLFHNESESAPGRLFTADEWDVFLSGYLSQVTLTARERELWPAALTHMLWEEGSWALEDNDAAAWAHPRQGAFLRDLARTDAARFPLSRS